MLIMCDKQDGQTFMGGVPKHIGFGWALCRSESHESMQGPGVVDVTVAEANGGGVRRASRGAYGLMLSVI